MLKSDKLKLKIIDLLKKEGEKTLGQLKKNIKIAHHYTLTNALEFLEKIGLIETVQKGDKLGSKLVMLKK